MKLLKATQKVQKNPTGAEYDGYIRIPPGAYSAMLWR